MKTMSVVWTYPVEFSAVSWLIRNRTGGNSSHAIMMDTQTGMAYEAVGKGVVCRPIEAALKGKVVVAHCSVTITDQQYLAGIDYLETLRGRKYGKLTLTLHICSFFRKLGIGNDDDKTLICSELCIRWFQSVDLIDSEIDADNVDPFELKYFIRQIGLIVHDNGRWIWTPEK